MEDLNLEAGSDNDFEKKLKELISNVDNFETASMKTDSFEDETETFDERSLEVTNDETENDEISLNRLVLNDEFQSEDENLENEEEYLEDEEANSIKESEYSDESDSEYLENENLNQENNFEVVDENENDRYIRQLNELNDEVIKIQQLARELTKSMRSEIIEMIYEKFSSLGHELKKRLN